MSAFNRLAVSVSVTAMAMLLLTACTSSFESATSTTTAPSAEVSSAAPESSAVESTAFETHPPLDGAAASSVAADLGSGDAAKISAQVVLPSTVQLDPSVIQGLQELQPINIDDSSFKQLDSLSAQVYAKVGADQQDWTLIMLWQNDRWMLGDSIEGQQDLSQPPPDATDSGTASETAVTETS